MGIKRLLVGYVVGILWFFFLNVYCSGSSTWSSSVPVVLLMILLWLPMHVVYSASLLFISSRTRWLNSTLLLETNGFAIAVCGFIGWPTYMARLDVACVLIIMNLVFFFLVNVTIVAASTAIKGRTQMRGVVSNLPAASRDCFITSLQTNYLETIGFDCS
jgi:hypothetical protein